MRTKIFTALVALVALTGCSSSQSCNDDTLVASNYKGHNPHRSHSLSKRRIKIVIDPGHGGDDYGTYSNEKPRQHEKYLAMSTSLMLKDHLEKMGYTVIMTRGSDIGVPLKGRVKIASRERAHLFVSMHYNSAPSTKASGVEIFYYRPKKVNSRSKESAKIAESVLARVLQSTKAKSRGVKHGNFCVVRDTTMPAILVEGGFLTNSTELKKVKNPRYQNEVARGVAEGIDDYITKNPSR